MTHPQKRMASRHRPPARRNSRRVVTFLALLLANLALFGAAVPPATAQAQETVAENSTTEFVLEANASGVPISLSADVVPSADLIDFVVDVYLDSVLVSSEREPTTLSIDFEPTSADRIIRVDVRDYGERFVCELDSGSIQLQNIQVARTPSSADDDSLLGQPVWAVMADTPAEVANVAAIGTHSSTAADFRVAEEAPVTVRVGEGEVFETSQRLWTDLVGASQLFPNADERRIFNSVTELLPSGGSVFISETAFGGRVGSVRLEAEMLMTPLAPADSGFALRINGQIVHTGRVDAQGQAAFELVIDEDSWPRDATVTLELSLVDADVSCTDERPFSGQLELTAVPVGNPSAAITVADFPALLLEGTPTLFAGPDVSSFDIAVVSSALQAISTERIVFADAEDRSSANLVIERSTSGYVVVDGTQLVVALTDQIVDVLQEERFWVFDSDVIADRQSLEEVPDSLAFVDLDDTSLSDASVESSLYADLPFALLVLLVAAVLRLLWKNSRPTAES